MTNQKKICIIDDEHDITDLCLDYLQPEYEIEVFDSAIKALNSFDSGNLPDLIVSDLKMPQMDGLELAKALEDKSIKTPFIMMSGHAEKSHVIEAMDHKILHFIEKPFDISKFKKTIQSTLSESAQMIKTSKLVNLYREQTYLFMELTNKYFNRLAVAENKFFDSPKPFFFKREEVKDYLDQIKEENEISRKIQKISDEIESLSEEIKFGINRSSH